MSKIELDLIDLIENFEDGDVVTLASIREEIIALTNNLSHDKKIFELIDDLPHFIEHLASASKNQKQIMDKLLDIIKIITEYIDSEDKEKNKLLKNLKKAISKFKNEFNYENTTKVEKDKEEAKTTTSQTHEEVSEGSYTLEDFSHLVEDPKLLMQFYHEAVEHLDSSQFILLELEYDSTNSEFLNTIFRDFHTIKGSSSFLGIKNIEDVSHVIEELFVKIRDGKMTLTKELVDVIFYGIHLIKNILDVMHALEFEVEAIKKSFIKIKTSDYIAILKKILKESNYKRIGEILVEDGKLSLEQLRTVLQKQGETSKKFGQIVTEENIINKDDLIQALKKQQNLKNKTKKFGFVKVSNEKLNSLIDYVGELVINQSMLKQEIEKTKGNSNLLERTLSQIEMITSSIKDLVLSMGMVPVEEIFNKLRVVVRNTAQELNKAVIIEIYGAETELDRNVIETLYDPLMHIVRNAIDHGIESPEERIKAGKDKIGKIILSAEHKGSGIEITIHDDGGGIDTQKIIEKALRLNLISKDNAAALSEKDIYSLLFLPGFSTNDVATSVSGRGVGLDVVKKNLEQIHGRVEIQSEYGKYTKFIIKLPLTLAIIEGFVTLVGGNKYIFPFNAIEEILVFEKNKLQKQKDSQEAILYYKDMHIPVIFANKILKQKQKDDSDKETYLSLLFSFEDSRYCVVVDQIIGKQEVVVKNLGDVLMNYDYFSGGTIFGDGTIGFVIDLHGFIESIK